MISHHGDNKHPQTERCQNHKQQDTMRDKTATEALTGCEDSCQTGQAVTQKKKRQNIYDRIKGLLRRCKYEIMSSSFDSRSVVSGLPQPPSHLHSVLHLTARRWRQSTMSAQLRGFTGCIVPLIPSITCCPLALPNFSTRWLKSTKVD